jgi:hypothetical protein
MPDRAFILSEFLSKLGENLQVDAVIIDLRAGLSELSAPYLFDPRVRRVFVTTTSRQSIEGTKFVLDKIFNSSFAQKSLVNIEDTADPTILLTMIPNDFDSMKRNNIRQDLLDALCKKTQEIEGDEDQLFSDVIIDSEFSERLIHLEDFEQVNTLLEGSSIARSSVLLSSRVVFSTKIEEQQAKKIDESTRKEIIDKIHDIVAKEVTAEGTSGVQLMATGALEKFAKVYEHDIPRVVILGAKGSGKTYIYKQLLDKVYWENFTAKVLSKAEPIQSNVMIMLILATVNRSAISSLLEKCFENINKQIGIDPDILNKNEIVLGKNNEDNAINPTQWLEIWNKLFLDSMSKDIKYNSFAELDAKLSAIGQKLVFIIDGLEDVFNQTITSKNSQSAIKFLCQDFVKSISGYKNIGIIIFIRNDIAKNSIQVNYDQFASQYADYALKWTQDEALRLVVWILAQIQFNDYQKDREKIPKLTHEALVERLYSLWGRKLGKDGSNEAFSSRWILAALSDLNLQIQARDIIRFLEAVTENYGKGTVYHDRILLPGDIRKAIIPCSQKKLEE